MPQLSIDAPLLAQEDQLYIDHLITKLAPYFGETDDDLPIFDIIIDHGTKPGWYRSSVAIFLPDAAFQAHAESQSAEKAVKAAFDGLTRKVTAHTPAKQRQKDALPAFINKATKRRTLYVLPKH